MFKIMIHKSPNKHFNCPINGRKTTCKSLDELDEN